MEIRVLRYFLTVARERSITGAAEALHITQPTLSRQIKELEQELGKKLFDRSSHSVSLTAEGMTLRKRAEEILEMVFRTKAEFAADQKIVGGDVYIGGGETEAMKIVAETVKEIRDDYPDIHFHLYSGNASDVTERLDKGLLDFGLLIMPTDVSKYDSLPLPAKDVWGVLMKKNVPLGGKKTVTKRDLLRLPLICSRQVINPDIPDNDFKNWFDKDFEKLNIVATYNLLFNAALLVEQGVGYALTLDKLVDTMNQSNVCFRPLEPRLESGVCLVWKKYASLSEAAKIFLNTLKNKSGKK